MNAVDFRDETFERVKETLVGRRRAVADAWREHGPGTTREVAAKAGIDILSFRPRSTELLQIGFLMLEVGEDSNRGSEGVYRARLLHEWESWVDTMKGSWADGQLKLI